MVQTTIKVSKGELNEDLYAALANLGGEAGSQARATFNRVMMDISINKTTERKGGEQLLNHLQALLGPQFDHFWNAYHKSTDN